MPWMYCTCRGRASAYTVEALREPAYFYRRILLSTPNYLYWVTHFFRVLKRTRLRVPLHRRALLMPARWRQTVNSLRQRTNTWRGWLSARGNAFSRSSSAGPAARPRCVHGRPVLRIRDLEPFWPPDPGSGMGTKSGSRIRNEQPGSYVRELRNHFLG